MPMSGESGQGLTFDLTDLYTAAPAFSRAGGSIADAVSQVQSHGSTHVSQNGRSCCLDEGDACIIDEAGVFQLSGKDSSGILFLRVPRTAA